MKPENLAHTSYLMKLYEEVFLECLFQNDNFNKKILFLIFLKNIPTVKKIFSIT